MQDLIADFMAWLISVLGFVRYPPYAALFIMLVSVSISTTSNLAMKRFSDMRRLQRHQLEIKQFREMEKEAQKTQNEKLLRKVKRRKAYIDKIQRDQLGARCKPSLIFMIPFMLIFSILRGFYSGPEGDLIVAVLPFNAHYILPITNVLGTPVPGGFGMTYWGFYFLVGLGLSSILQRIMGTQVMTA